jgi:hypothetical protein
LHKALFAYRTSIHGFTPCHLNFGQSPTLPIDNVLGQPSQGFSAYPELLTGRLLSLSSDVSIFCRTRTTKCNWHSSAQGKDWKQLTSARSEHMIAKAQRSWEWLIECGYIIPLSNRAVLGSFLSCGESHTQLWTKPAMSTTGSI